MALSGIRRGAFASGCNRDPPPNRPGLVSNHAARGNSSSSSSIGLMGRGCDAINRSEIGVYITFNIQQCRSPNLKVTVSFAIYVLR